MLAVKFATFCIKPTEELLSLLETFRLMVNDAVTIGYENQPKRHLFKVRK